MSEPTVQNDSGDAAEPAAAPAPMHPYDDWGRPLGYCNDCGEEALLNGECCEDGEVVPFDNATCREEDL